MDWKTWELCYPGYSDGEIDAMLGPVFGCATMSAGGRPDNFTMGPSDCDECESPNIQYNWVNRLYTGFCALCMVKSRNGIHGVCLCVALSA